LSSRKTKDKVPIELEVINTPRGDVPTAKSFKEIVNALNLLDEEIQEIRGSFLTHIDDLNVDIKSLKKLIAEETVTLEALNENIKNANEKLNAFDPKKLDVDERKVAKILTKEIADLLDKVVSNQKEMEKSFVSALNSMAKVVDMKLNLEKK
jgi:septal ring factor EnvC (AmiA/AmiB activator)